MAFNSSMIKKRGVFIILILLILVNFLINFVNVNPIVPDEFERIRIINQTIDAKEYVKFDEFVYPRGINFVYPPLLDYLVSLLSIFTLLPVIFLVKWLPFVFFIVFILIVYLFSRKILNEKEQMIALFLIGLIPLIFRRFSSLVNESVGLTLILFIFYILMFKKSEKISSILFATLLLFHLRSFSTALLILLIYLIYQFFKKEKLFASKKFFIFPILFALIFNEIILRFFSLNSVINPWINFSFNSIVTFLSFPVLLLFIFTLIFLFKIEKLKFILIWIIVPLVIFLTHFTNLNLINQAYREIIFFIVPLSFVSSKILIKIFEKSKVWAFVLLFFLLVPMFLIFPNSPYSNQDYSVKEFVLENVGKEKLILADDIGFLLSSEKQKLYIVSYMERFKDGSERLKNTYNFFRGNNTNIPYNCFILRNSYFVSENNLKIVDKLYSTPKNELYCKKE